MKERFKKFLRDIYEGIYFLSRKHERGNVDWFIIRSRFLVGFFSYYISVFLLLLGIKVTIDGPFKSIESIVILLVVYIVTFALYNFALYSLLDTSEIDENIEPSIKKNKIRKSILVQVGGLVCFILSVVAVYFLYKK